LISAMLGVWMARRDGDDVRVEARTLALAYVGALLGGYALEVLRSLPAAIAAGSLQPLLHVGRAAYGGLLFAVVLSFSYRLARGLPVAPFLDRAMLAGGVCFLAIRTGCFL